MNIFKNLSLIHNMRAHEYLHACILVLPFMCDDGCLTPTLKINRFNICKKYKIQIENVYAVMSAESDM